jgi:uncharacterized protein YaiE (UPF0345 family)
MAKELNFSPDVSPLGSSAVTGTVRQEKPVFVSKKTPPSVVRQVVVTALSQGYQVTAVAPASSGNAPLSGYVIYRNDRPSPLATVSQLPYLDLTAPAGSLPGYRISALNLSGVEGPKSTMTTVSAGGPVVTVPTPSLPTSVTIDGSVVVSGETIFSADDQVLTLSAAGLLTASFSSGSGTVEISYPPATSWSALNATTGLNVAANRNFILRVKHPVNTAFTAVLTINYVPAT